MPEIRKPQSNQLVIDQLEQTRAECRTLLGQDAFSFTARFSGDPSRPCLCEKPILQGEEITKVPYCSRWIHTVCAELDRSEGKPKSKAFELIEKLAKQATEKEAVWKEDLLNLAKLAYLGKWGTDYWLEDTILATRILDIFGMHKLTRGIERRSYASKLEKEFAARKGWICRKCRHLIWVEKSVERGVGPVCLSHTIEEQLKKESKLIAVGTKQVIEGWEIPPFSEECYICGHDTMMHGQKVIGFQEIEPDPNDKTVYAKLHPICSVCAQVQLTINKDGLHEGINCWKPIKRVYLVNLDKTKISVYEVLDKEPWICKASTTRLLTPSFTSRQVNRTL